MSVAVAVRKGGVIAIAADSQENFGDCKMLRRNLRSSKIVALGSSYLATSGWGLYENILEDQLARGAAPRLGSRAAIFSFFLRLWRQMGKKYSLVNDQPNQDNPSPFADLDSSFLVANRGGIYHVSGNLTVSEFHAYYAVGSGAPYALGALHALFGERLGAEALARRACEAATEFDVYCGGEIDVFTLKEGAPTGPSRRAGASRERRRSPPSRPRS
jgi:ATP-dependent protease HslVU (ClpYQ) peptidase subunit